MDPTSPENRSALLPSTLAMAVVAMLFIGGIDVFTGEDVELSQFYIVTVVFVAWRSGRGAALGTAVGCAVIGVVADHLVRVRFGASLARDAVRVWNGLSHLVVYAITGHVVAILKSTLDDRDRLIGELRDAAANIRKLEGLLPVCAWCKKLRDDARDGAWVPIDDYITTHTDAMISHGICPRCAEQHFGENT